MSELSTLLEEAKAINAEATRHIEDWDPEDSFIAHITKLILSGSPKGGEQLAETMFPIMFPDDLLVRIQIMHRAAAALDLDEYRKFYMEISTDSSPAPKIQSIVVNKLKSQFMSRLGIGAQ